MLPIIQYKNSSVEEEEVREEPVWLRKSLDLGMRSNPRELVAKPRDIFIPSHEEAHVSQGYLSSQVKSETIRATTDPAYRR